MRLSGLSSGLDIDQMMKDLMRAERMPVNKLEKQKTELGWKMDGYREINLKMRSLHTSMFDSIMRSSNMLKRSVVSSNQAVISATASSTVGNTSFTINKVSQMATSATAQGTGLGTDTNEKTKLSELSQLNDSTNIKSGWVSGSLHRENIALTDGVVKLEEKPTLAEGANQLIINGKGYEVATDAGSLSSGQVFISDEGELTFAESENVPARLQIEYIKEDPSSTDRFSMSTVSTTKNEQGELTSSSFFFKDSDTVETVTNKLRSAGAGVNAFFDEHHKAIVVTRKETGTYSNAVNHNDVQFEGALFQNVFGLDDSKVQNGENAKFTINGVETERRSNTFNISGMTITLKDVSEQAITLGASTDVDSIFDTISSFVNEYNDLVDLVNGKLNERYYRDYEPLTDEERDAMSESEAKRWDEQAQSGMLRNDSLLQSSLNRVRQGLYQTVDSGNSINHLTQLGISTTRDYADGGKLVINEDQLRAAIEEDADAVYAFFNGTSDQPGIAQTMRSNLQEGMSSLSRKAGGSEGFHEQQQYAIGQQTKSIEDRIEAFERRLEQKESRYWRQFTAMERAMQMANQQSESLFNLLYNN